MSAMADTVVAVDVGSHQVRAGLFDTTGAMIFSTNAPITLIQPSEMAATYRMDEIWDTACAAVRRCAREAHAQDARVIGLAFDATSSLYVDHGGEAISEDEGDVFGWMDHRAEKEALEIDRTAHPYLGYFGNTISPEIHLPKILWLKRKRPHLFDGRIRFRDVCDELARRVTGVDAHSISALVCKWPYVPGRPEPWCRDLLRVLGLAEAGLDISSTPARPLGAVHGTVSHEASERLGLAAGTVVAVGAIDAEAGILGNVGPNYEEAMRRTLLVTGGTSTNFMVFSDEGRSIPGVWGPFHDVVFPGYWLHEGGQSLSGGALDAIFLRHPASPGAPTPENHERVVNDVLAQLETEGTPFGRQRHLVPDWLGNRSPLNDSRVKAIMSGIGNDVDHASFLETYYATARGLALQMRHVIEHFNRHGYAIDTVHLSGGHRHNPLLVHLYADCLHGTLAVVDAPEPVLLGSAMIAAVAARCHASLFEAANHMSSGRTVVAAEPRRAAQLDAAYRIYKRLFDVRNELFAASPPA